MDRRISQAKAYTLVLLKPNTGVLRCGLAADRLGTRKAEHGIASGGIMPIVCPVGDEEISGIGIFNTDPDEARAIMADDPGARAGIFTVEVHNCRGFPGDVLPS